MNENKKILLVDDDEDFIIQQKMGFKKIGYTVLEAYAREDAIDILEKEKPDCAVIDLMMEKADDGFILAHAMKKKYPDMPVILVTAVTQETGLTFGIVEESEKKWVKADVVLAKPVRFEQLNQEVERLL